MDRLAMSKGWALALIVGGGLLAYHNVLGHSFHYDDDHSILENPHIRSLANVPRFFVDPGTFSGMPEARMYRPLLLVTYAFNHAIGGYQPLGWHLVNMLLHLANAALLWWAAPVWGASRRAALIAGALFAVHPLLSESVNYVCSRSSLLATFFLLLACRGLGATGCWRTAVPFGCALLTKSIAIVLPAIAVLHMALVGRWRRDVLAALAVIGALYVAGTQAIIGKAIFEPVRGPVEQWATQLKAGAFYVWKVAMPVGLSVEPQFSTATSAAGAPVLLAVALLMSLAWFGWRARRCGLVVFGLGWFAIALLPTSLVPLHVLVNEHRLYLPLAGLALATGALLEKLPLHRGWPLALAILIGLAIQRNAVWRDEETLWRDAVAKGPQMARPHVNLGKALLRKGALDEAIVASHRALAIDPDLDRAHYNIGTAYMRQERYELAIAHFRRALEIRPEMLPALNNLGNAYQEQGLYDPALATYRRALAVQEHASIYHNIGHTFAAARRADSAQVYYRFALELDPDLRESYKGLVKALRSEDRLQSAVVVLDQALRRWPQDQLMLLLRGDALAALGREEEAAASYRRAGKEERDIWPRLGAEALRRQGWTRALDHFGRALEFSEAAIAHNGRGTALLELGQIEAALAAFRRAARLEPERATAYANIGRAFLRYGRAVEAAAAMEKACSLEPETGRLQALWGQALERMGKTEAAAAAYKRAIAREPEVGEYYHNLGFIYAGMGEKGEAETMFRKALMRNPQQVEAYFNLGGLYLEQRRYQRAVDTYAAVLELTPDYADAWINLASVQLNMGRNAEALSSYRRCLQLELSAEVRTRVERQIAVLEVLGD